MTTESISSYPPDNAAILYYQAALLYRINDDMKINNDMKRTLRGYWQGDIEISDKVKEHILRSRAIVSLLETAGNIPHCDWAPDYSQGIGCTSPHILPCGSLAELILCDARFLVSKGKDVQALNHIITVQKMARHAAMGQIICFAISSNIIKMANRSLQLLLSSMSPDLQMLAELKKQLAKLCDAHSLFKTSFQTELDLLNISIEQLLEQDFPQPFTRWVKAKLPTQAADFAVKSLEEFRKKNRKHLKDFTCRLRQALELDPREALATMLHLRQQLSQENETPDAAMTVFFFCPSCDSKKCCQPGFGFHIEGLTFSNAIDVALEVYIIKAQTGKLPCELPEGLPKDVFSGEDFEYVKANNGFILRCQGKDARKDKIHEYEFKVL